MRRRCSEAIHALQVRGDVLNLQGDAGFADCGGHLGLPHPHVRVGGIGLQAQRHLVGSCGDRVRVLEVDAAVQHVPRQRAIHRSRRQFLGHRGLTRTRRAIDRNGDANARDRVLTQRVVHPFILLIEVVLMGDEPPAPLLQACGAAVSDRRINHDASDAGLRARRVLKDQVFDVNRGLA